MSIFPMEKRESIKTAMLEVGIKLIKEKGMQHITISEISKQSGIGKGTFYHFYEAKESFIFEVIFYSKEKIYHEINRIVEENGGINRKNFEKLFNMFSFTGNNNIIGAITLDDEKWLAKKLSLKKIPNSSNEEAIIQRILENGIGIREDINHHVLANMMKIMGLAVENKEFLYYDVLEENIRLIVRQIVDYIFIREEG